MKSYDTPEKRLRLKLQGPPEHTPGSRTWYTHYGCRCDACCDVNAAYQRAFRRRRHHERNFPLEEACS